MPLKIKIPFKKSLYGLAATLVGHKKEKQFENLYLNTGIVWVFSPKPKTDTLVRSLCNFWYKKSCENIFLARASNTKVSPIENNSLSEGKSLVTIILILT